MFHIEVRFWLDVAVLLFALVLMAWAFIHAAIQRPDGFAAIGGFRKHHWMIILAGLFLFTLLLNFPLGAQGTFSKMFIYVGIGFAAYYLLDTRRGLKDLSEGPW